MLRNCQYRLAFVILLLIAIVCLIIKYQWYATVLLNKSANRDATSAVVRKKDDWTNLEDVMLSERKPKLAHSIFFLETSCIPLCPWSPTQLQLTARQACAIVSAAYHNPNFDVFVLFATPVHNFKNKTIHPFIEAILAYRNVHIRYLNISTFAKDTPAYDWLMTGKLFESRYITAHFSDFLRILTLWRWGGTYLDMDTVTLHSLEDLLPNYTGAQSNVEIANGVMNFAPNGFGHEVAERCLQNFQNNFDGESWANNGPGVIQRVLEQICDTQNITLMFDKKRCLTFQVYEPNVFYTIPYQNWYQFFDRKRYKEVLVSLDKALIAHVWNHLSSKQVLDVGEKVAYLRLAERNCPNVIDATGDYF